MVPGLPGTGPGTARQRKLGQGREGRKEGKEREGKERACDAERSGPPARMDGWIDGQRRDQEQCVKQTSRMSCQVVIEGVIFFVLLSSDQFSYRI